MWHGQDPAPSQPCCSDEPSPTHLQRPERPPPPSGTEPLAWSYRLIAGQDRALRPLHSLGFNLWRRGEKHFSATVLGKARKSDEDLGCWRVLHCWEQLRYPTLSSRRAPSCRVTDSPRLTKLDALFAPESEKGRERVFNKQKWKGGGSLLLLFIQCSTTEGLLVSRREQLFRHIPLPLQGEVVGAGGLQLLVHATDLSKCPSTLPPQLSHLLKL